MKKTLLTIIITAVICISTTAFAIIKLDSSEVSYTDKTENETTVKEALDTLYSNINGTATSADILYGKTAYSKGQFLTGTYKIPNLSITLQIGSHGSAETAHQTRVNMQGYMAAYKYFKITLAKCETNGLCSNIWFNSQCDQSTGNMNLNTQYETANYPGFTIFTTGSRSYYYSVVLYLYN